MPVSTFTSDGRSANTHAAAAGARRQGSRGTAFQTDYRYVDRRTKSRYVWLKYRDILRARRILDVGADNCFLKSQIDSAATYWGIGLGGAPDQHVDLEQANLPFDSRSFDTVLCLDVLEHLENAHRIFDELCRVSRRHVILSLPNPWKDFWRMLRKGPYRREEPLKYYGLPVGAPQDRHRWFFNQHQAREFIGGRARRCDMVVIQMDDETDGCMDWMTRVARWWQTLGLRGTTDVGQLYAGTLWAVLEKSNRVSR